MEEHARKRSRAYRDRGRECDLDGQRPLTGINGSRHLGHQAFDDSIARNLRGCLVYRDLHAIALVHVRGTRFIDSHHDLAWTARFHAQERQPG